MMVGVYMVLNKVEVVKYKEVVVDNNKVPSSRNDQTNCEFKTLVDVCIISILFR